MIGLVCKKSEIKLYFDVTRSIQLRCVPFYSRLSVLNFSYMALLIITYICKNKKNIRVTVTYNTKSYLDGI